MKIKSISSGHGLKGSSQGHPETMGVVGPGGSFVGRKYEMDNDRTDITDKDEEVGEVGSKKVPKGVGIKNLGRTGGQGRKFAGTVGTGNYQGTT